MFVLDTDTLTLLHYEHPGVIRNLEECRRAATPVATTVVTKGEILRGRIEYLMKADDEASLLKAQHLLLNSEQRLKEVPILLLDNTALAVFIRLRAMKGLKKLGRGDMLIASIALAHNATLVSRNRSHFRLIPNLPLANWVD